jgi:hypothetical protein
LRAGKTRFGPLQVRPRRSSARAEADRPAGVAPRCGAAQLPVGEAGRACGGTPVNIVSLLGL